MLVDVLDYDRGGRVRVLGFKDERRAPTGTGVRIEPAEALARARMIFHREVPEDVRAELSPLGLRRHSALYVGRWIRRVRGVPVLGNETFEVGLNGVTGDVVYWELGLFDFPAAVMNLGLGLREEEARERALEAVRERGLPHRPLPVPPTMLVVHGREPYYGAVFAAADPRDRLYVAVHGRTGAVRITPRNEEFEEVAAALRAVADD